jgi:type IV secretory pathway VirB10-like protein
MKFFTLAILTVHTLAHGSGNHGANEQTPTESAATDKTPEVNKDETSSASAKDKGKNKKCPAAVASDQAADEAKKEAMLYRRQKGRRGRNKNKKNKKTNKADNQAGNQAAAKPCPPGHEDHGHCQA